MKAKDITSDPLPTIPARRPDSHKGDYGRVLLIGGSRGMAGAIGLSGMAALRSGAGLVTLGVPQAIQSTVAGFQPSAMTHGLGDAQCDHLVQEHRREIEDLAESTTCVAIGPGIGRRASTFRLVQTLYRRMPVPLVVDAAH